MHVHDCTYDTGGRIFGAGLSVGVVTIICIATFFGSSLRSPTFCKQWNVQRISNMSVAMLGSLCSTSSGNTIENCLCCRRSFTTSTKAAKGAAASRMLRKSRSLLVGPVRDALLSICLLKEYNNSDIFYTFLKCVDMFLLVWDIRTYLER